MIAGLVALIGIIFGSSGSAEYFYLAGFDKSINKYVDDKELKQELKASLKDYTKAVKEYEKKRSKLLKDFKAKNLEQGTDEQWYKDHFKSFMALKKDRQEKAIALRLEIQPRLTDEEWSNIVGAAKKTVTEDQAKMDKKAAKKEKQAVDGKLIDTAEKYITDEEKQNGVDDAYKTFRTDVQDLRVTYEDINVVDNELLSSKYVTEKQLREFVESLNSMRLEMYDDYLTFINKLREVTTEEEWTAIMKDLNKSI